MERLVTSTTAYQTFCNDAATGRLSHAYMLHFADGKNLRGALKLFALALFGAEKDSRTGSLILREAFADCTVYPEEGKKITVDGVSALIEDASLRPLEGDKKAYLISGFEQAAPLVQNKLLKILEEPPRGVTFILGATTLAPVLDTVKSRVKTLAIPPFTPQEIYGALERKFPHNPQNGVAAEGCGGDLGMAENMVGGDWYGEIRRAALEICTADSLSAAADVAAKYGDVKYKNELLAEMQRLYFSALCTYAGREGEEEALAVRQRWKKPVLAYAAEQITGAAADVKFNAYFSGLLYSFVLKLIEENEKWKKSSV